MTNAQITLRPAQVKMHGCKHATFWLASQSDGIALVTVAINNNLFFFSHNDTVLKVKCSISKIYH